MFSKNKKVIHNGCTLGCEYIIILKADTHVVDLKKNGISKYKRPHEIVTLTVLILRKKPNKVLKSQQIQDSMKGQFTHSNKSNLKEYDRCITRKIATNINTKSEKLNSN